MPDEAEIVEAASEAAERTVFATCDRSAVTDLDVTVKYVDDELSVDVYLDAADETIDEEALVEEAATAAGEAVDDLVDGT